MPRGGAHQQKALFLRYKSHSIPWWPFLPRAPNLPRRDEITKNLGTLASSLPICERSTDGFACSNVLQAAEEKDNELPEQDKLTRTARVQPTPQTKDPDGPNTPSTDRRK